MAFASQKLAELKPELWDIRIDTLRQQQLHRYKRRLRSKVARILKDNLLKCSRKPVNLQVQYVKQLIQDNLTQQEFLDLQEDAPFYFTDNQISEIFMDDGSTIDSIIDKEFYDESQMVEVKKESPKFRLFQFTGKNKPNKVWREGPKIQRYKVLTTDEDIQQKQNYVRQRQENLKQVRTEMLMQKFIVSSKPQRKSEPKLPKKLSVDSQKEELLRSFNSLYQSFDELRRLEIKKKHIKERKPKQRVIINKSLKDFTINRLKNSAINSNIQQHRERRNAFLINQSLDLHVLQLQAQKSAQKNKAKIEETKKQKQTNFIKLQAKKAIKSNKLFFP